MTMLSVRATACAVVITAASALRASGMRVTRNAAEGSSEESSRLVVNSRFEENICNDACSSSKLQDPCKLHAKCVALADDAEVQEEFPNFESSWCDTTMETIYMHACKDGESETPVHMYEMFITKLQAVTEIVAKEAPAAALITGSCNTATDCYECNAADHRQGVLNFMVTSTACAWNEDQGSCEPFVDSSNEYMSSTAVCSDYELRESSERLIASAPKKRALLVGFKYSGRNQLNGTVPDIIRVYKHLKNNGFRMQDIHVFTDDTSQFLTAVGNGAYNVISANCGGGSYGNTYGSNSCGTVAKLQSVFDKFASQVEEGDHVAFHYSGHGSYVDDKSGDELDGKDETMVTPNVEHFLDDSFYAWLVSLKAATVAAVSDACHNEGLSDLPFNYMSSRRYFCTDWASARKLPTANILFMSGSKNYQTSADFGIGGALTLSMVGQNGDAGRPASPAYKYMADTWSDFTRQRVTQRPNLCSWPTFRDTSTFTPFLLTGLQFDRGNGGSSPKYNSFMVVPSICNESGTHQGSSSTEYWRRKKVNFNQAKFRLDERLRDSTASRQTAVAGWEDATSTYDAATSYSPTPRPRPRPTPTYAPTYTPTYTPAYTPTYTHTYTPTSSPPQQKTQFLQIYPNCKVAYHNSRYYYSQCDSGFITRSSNASVVLHVTYGGPAAKAGLKNGAVIEKISHAVSQWATPSFFTWGYLSNASKDMYMNARYYSLKVLQ